MATQASQYRKIMESNSVLWNPESPVIIEKMILQYDRLYGTNVLQLTFRNVSELNIYGLSIKIIMKTESGTVIDENVAYNYYGMEVEPHKYFGATEDIVVEKEAAQFEIHVFRAELGDGQNYRGDAKLAPMPYPQPVESFGEFTAPFVERLTAQQPKIKIICAPEKKDNWWRCVCQRIYPDSVKECPYCKIDAETVLSIIPNLKKEQKMRELEAAQKEKQRREEEERKKKEEEERLQKEREEREAAEKAEIARREEEARIKREEAEAEMRRIEAKRKKILSIVIPSAVGALLIALFCIFLLPEVLTSLKPEKTTEAPSEATSSTEVSTEPTTEEPTTTEAPTEPTTQETKPVTDDRLPIVVLGEDLSMSGERTMWRLFGITEEELGRHDTVLVSRANAMRCLGYVYGNSNMESEAISGMLVIPTAEGSGLDVTMYNISYCSEQMYADMLGELGFTDAKVIVAAPDEASGSTAMTGLKILAGQLSSDTGEVAGYAVSRMAMNVRSGPSVDYPVYRSIPAGTVISVLEELENGWYCIVWEEAPDGYAFTSNLDGKFYSFGQ